MTTIRVMSETLANQIAAGEVIERPASVVKELIENAIDANATVIDVHIKESGLRLIQVSDNGDGIPYKDVPLAFQRHATSKLLSNQELFRIRTLGFRGEALPSIASISQLTIETAEEYTAGRRLVLKNGHTLEDSRSPARKGTMIQVEDLFFNTPARLKHLKSLQTELSHVIDSVNRFSLAHPDISFKLVHDDATLTRTSGNKNIQQTIAAIYGVQTAKKMRRITGEDFDFKIDGYVSLPDTTRSNRSYITIIVNGRYIKNFALNRAIISGYKSKLMINRYPIAVIHITMDPQLLDVNVHPTKYEVRISQEAALCELIQQAINDTLSREVRIPSAMDTIGLFEHSEAVTSTTVDQPTVAMNIKSLNTDDQSVQENSMVTPQKTYHQVSHHIETVEEFSPKLSDTLTINQQHDMTLKSDDHFPALEYIGQLHGTYLCTQNEQGLYLIDQHAAQERIKYEYYRQVIGDTDDDQQQLLIPIIVEYPMHDAIKIREHLADLEAVGIYLEEFGQHTFMLNSHPSWFTTGQEEQIVRDMIETVLEMKQLTIADFRHETAVMMSCKHSIKANHYLNHQEASTLINDLANCQNPYNCPHGRPVLVTISNQEIEKLFKRIQDR